MDTVRNEQVRRRAGIETELVSRADQSIDMVWACGKNVYEYRMARRVFDGRSRWGAGTRETEGMDGVKVALGNRGMMVKAA